jgi:signal transduction histidine kinase
MEVLARSAAAAREIARAEGACAVWVPAGDSVPAAAGASGAVPADAARLAAPFRAAGEARGAVVVFRPAVDGPVDVRGLETLAALTASGARNAVLVDGLRARTKRGDELLLHAAHEVKRPLTSLAANVELLEDEVPGVDRDAVVERIRHAVEDMREVTDDVLSYERLVAGRMPMEPFDLGSSAQRAVRAVAPDRTFAEGPPGVVVLGDERLVTAAIRNLVENAAKFSRVESRIVVRWMREDGWGVVTVHDEGPGIEPGDQTRIFEPFERLPSAAGTEGSGLGLSLVKAVAEGHGGAVEVESAAGRGATFTLRLPAEA